MQSTLIFFSFVVLTTLVLPSEERCEQDQERHGCRIQDNTCVCGSGCYTEYRYNDKDECTKALKARRNDVCQRKKCQHGVCSQTIQEPGFKCRCEGTGYFGARCQLPCPKPGSDPIGTREYPYECIVI